MKISVIVTCHNRREYILEALRSLDSQTFGDFEVIVVKNYVDDKIDRYIEDRGFTNVLDTNVKLGHKVAAGLRNSRGEIITFLEDDDMYQAHRLERLAKVFEDPRVTYFHNDAILVDENGRTMVQAEPVEETSRVRDEEKRVKLKYLDDKRAGFNNSSIAVRRELVERYLGEINNINISLDNFIFFSALCNSGDIVTTDSRLTFYRIHASNTSFSNASFTAWVERNIQVLPRYMEDREIMLKLFRGCFIERKLRTGFLWSKRILALLSRINNSPNKVTLQLADLSSSPSAKQFLVTSAFLTAQYFPNTLGRYLLKRIYTREMKRITKIFKLERA